MAVTNKVFCLELQERAMLSKQRLLTPWVRTGMSRIAQTGAHRSC